MCLLFGLKDLSLIETPPKDRHAVQTYVLAFDKNIIRDIIYRELSRDGQVFILYNRVEDIESKVREIQMIVPEARVAFAHGKMNKNDLENIMNDFVLHEYDVLVCTTIIETGVDIPNVNTLIVYNSDWFGLSQLYQIRGRVGRSDRKDFKYLRILLNLEVVLLLLHVIYQSEVLVIFWEVSKLVILIALVSIYI